MQRKFPTVGMWLMPVSRHEKHVSRQLRERCIESFLSTYLSVHQWKDRRKELAFPLFPGYVFVRLSAEGRHRVFTIPGVFDL